jgi:hypothetical protein
MTIKLLSRSVVPALTKVITMLAEVFMMRLEATSRGSGEIAPLAILGSCLFGLTCSNEKATRPTETLVAR